jgi:hypothetical protein
MNALKQTISIIEWDIVLMSFVCLSVFLVEGTEGPGENLSHVTTDKLYDIMLYTSP